MRFVGRAWVAGIKQFGNWGQWVVGLLWLLAALGIVSFAVVPAGVPLWLAILSGAISANVTFAAGAYGIWMHDLEAASEGKVAEPHGDALTASGLHIRGNNEASLTGMSIVGNNPSLPVVLLEGDSKTKFEQGSIGS